MFQILRLISSSHSRTLKAFRLYPLFFVVTFSAYFLINLFFDWAMIHLADPRQGPWLIQISAGLTDLTAGGLLLFAYGFALQNSEHKPLLFSDFFRTRISPFITESLLALSRILLWSLLLILPGLVFYVLYLFIPYVVFYSANYQKNEIGALEESKRLIKPHFFSVLIFVLLSGLISFGLEVGSKTLNMTLWWQELLFFIPAFYFTGFTFMFFYGLYLKYDEEKI